MNTISKKKQRDIKFWIFIFIMGFVELTSNFLIELGKYRHNYKLVIYGISIFFLSGYMYYKLLFYKDFIVVITVWILTCFIITVLISLFYFRQSYSLSEKIGTFIAFISIYCLLK